jgi:hypothetical protein
MYLPRRISNDLTTVRFGFQLDELEVGGEGSHVTPGDLNRDVMPHRSFCSPPLSLDRSFLY